MNVTAIMNAHPATLPAGASLDEAIELMDARRVRHLPVVAGGRLVGLISDRDLLEATGWLPPRVREVLDAPPGAVDDFMAREPFAVTPDDGLEPLMERMASGHLGCVPVLSDGRLEGIVTESDLLRTYAKAVAEGRVPADQDPPVSAQMTRSPRTCAPDATVEDVLELLHEQRVLHAPVVDGGRLVGIVSDRDIRLSIGRGEAAGAVIRQFMTPAPATIGADAPLSSAAETMLVERFSSLPVTDGAQLVGILTLADVLRAIAPRLAGL